MKTIPAILFCLTLFILHSSHGQKVNDLDRYSLDTIKLTGLAAKKIVAIQHNDLTFYLDFNDYSLAVDDFKRKYLKGFRRRIKEVNSVLKKADRHLRASDTIFISKQDFHKVGIQPMEKLIAEQIDKGRCLIINSNNVIERTVIRVIGSFARGFLDAWSGRRYYLPKQEEHFILLTTAIS